MRKMASGFRAKRLLAVVFLLAVTGMARLPAFEIIFDSPKFGPTDSQEAREVSRAFQNAFDNVFNDIKDSINNEVKDIDPNPQELIRAFATTSVFSSTGASLRTFQGYNTFALTVGAMTGVQLPISISSMFRGVEYIGNEIFNLMSRNGDLRIGMNPQMVNAQLGINASRFLLKGLYVGIKGGYMSLPPLDLGGLDLSFQTWSIGGTVNYQLLPQIRIPTGIIVWRGISFGTGFIYQNTNLNLGIPLMPLINDSLPDLNNIGGTGVDLELSDPNFNINFGINTFTVPLEAVTSIRLLGFANFSFGAGVDFGFGSANLGAGINSRIEAKNLPSVNSVQITQVQSGSMKFSMNSSNSPTLVNPKIMASFAFSAGPAIILDIPFTYYFLNEGYNIGVTFGVAL
jgi:hypothetical protein